jgi:hypothetical protein
VGYRNGLFLNDDVAQATEWTVAHIAARTDKLVKLAIEAFPLPVGNLWPDHQIN